MSGGRGPPRLAAGAASAQAAFAEATRLHREGRLDEAEARYRQVLAADSTHVDALHLLGVSAAQRGDHARAAELIAAALEHGGDFALARYNLGKALQALGRFEEAAAAYAEAVRLEPVRAAAHNNLGAVLRALGRLEPAIAAYRAAIARQPSFPEACYNLGVALNEAGRIAEAADAFREALAQAPGDADAWHNLGVVLKALGRLEESLEAHARAVRLDPALVDGHLAVGAALFELGRHEASLAAYRRAVALAPDRLEPRLALGTRLHGAGDNAAAIAVLGEAVALWPGHPAALTALAVALQELGRAEAALDATGQALAADPTAARAWFVRADLKRFEPGDPGIAAMTRLLEAAPERLGFDDRLDLEFALAKALMDVGDADAAFARLEAGNRLKRASFSYDVEADIARMTALAESFPTPAADRFAAPGDPSDRPVFVVGMPRSGSTLVEQILASHPEAYGAGELPLLFELAREALAGGSLAALGRRYDQALRRLAPQARRVIDKMPANFQLVGLIWRMLPNARVIHCRRDPIDTCFSCYSKKFAGEQGFAYDLGELGRYYRGYAAVMDVWRAAAPADRFIEVHYEDVVDNLERQARRLIDFCGLDWDEACLSFHTTERAVRTASVNQVRRPISRSSLGRWRAYAAHLGPLLAALAD